MIIITWSCLFVGNIVRTVSPPTKQHDVLTGAQQNITCICCHDNSNDANKKKQQTKAVSSVTVS